MGQEAHVVVLNRGNMNNWEVSLVLPKYALTICCFG